MKTQQKNRFFHVFCVMAIAFIVFVGMFGYMDDMWLIVSLQDGIVYEYCIDVTQKVRRKKGIFNCVFIIWAYHKNVCLQIGSLG